MGPPSQATSPSFSTWRLNAAQQVWAVVAEFFGREILTLGPGLFPANDQVEHFFLVGLHCSSGLSAATRRGVRRGS